jgi:ATP-dependent exoDNAse (exonuclease V) beta subunit
MSPALASFVQRAATCATAADASVAFIERLRMLARRSSDRPAILDDGPVRSAEFGWLRADLAGLDERPADDPARTQQLRRRLERYFLRKDLKPRLRLATQFKAEHFPSSAAKKRHEAAVASWAPAILESLNALDVDVNGLLARGLQRVFAIAVDRYERLLDEHALMDFAGMLDRSVALLERQEEFARSRLKLQSRYHHVLVDEFQDTSRAQWRLVELLIDAWGEGEGVTDAPTSIFIVGDRKQSIYRFRHAEATLLDEAARKIAALRPGRPVRQAITHSFRAVPELLAFVNALSGAIISGAGIPERFEYGQTDRFPVPDVAPGALRDGEPVLGAIVQPTLEATADATAAEIVRLLRTTVVRDRTGAPRPVQPDDIAILFRARIGHQTFEEALEARGVRTYVYKGLGFFDAPEVQDVHALLRYLAEPDSNLRAAEFLRSRFVRLSDTTLARLGPEFAAALRARDLGTRADTLDDIDRRLLERARAGVARWLPLADRITPSELVDLILREAAYAYELRGRRLIQARENLKKIRAIIRRVESRGYATLGRLADYFQTLRAGDESNAIIEASGCVSLMTVHAAKGLEYPIVFVVNLQTPGRGRSAGFTVIERGWDGEPEVAFGTTDGTKLEDVRDDEELRRLFYVAVTRARDRLYFGLEVDPRGRVRRAARSLAALMPDDLVQALVAGAGSSADVAHWQSAHGAFAFRLCRPSPDLAIVQAPDRIPDRSDVPLDSAVLSVPRKPAGRAAHRSAVAPESGAPYAGDAQSDRLVGRLVHRLFQRRVPADMTERDIAMLATRLVEAGEPDDVDVPDLPWAATRAAWAFLTLRRNPEVVALLNAGRADYEVPFSARTPEGFVQGAIDCVVTRPDGTLTVLEFKTGARRPEHERQAALYATALSHACPGHSIDVKILYPEP